MCEPLQWTELKLLLILDEACQETDQVERDFLSVIARGRGLEVGSGLRRLQVHGLVEQFRIQPGYIRKRLGALPTDIIALTEHGRAVAKEVHVLCRGKPIVL